MGPPRVTVRQALNHTSGLPDYEAGAVERSEMYRTFNKGVGMVVFVPASEAGAVMDSATRAGVRAFWDANPPPPGPRV